MLSVTFSSPCNSIGVCISPSTGEAWFVIAGPPVDSAEKEVLDVA